MATGECSQAHATARGAIILNLRGSLEDSLLWHSLLVWVVALQSSPRSSCEVVMPACIVAQTYVPLLEPTCLNGYTNWSLLLLLVLEIHHILAERRGFKAFLS